MSTDGSVMFATKEAMRQQVGKLFADSPDLDTTIASQIVIGQLAGDEEQIFGCQFGDMPAEISQSASSAPYQARLRPDTRTVTGGS